MTTIDGFKEWEAVSGEPLPANRTPANMPVVRVRVRKPGVRGVPPVIRAHARTAGIAVARGSLRVAHPKTVGRASLFTLKGLGTLSGLMWHWSAGKDITELRTKNPEQHQKIVSGRRTVLAVLGAGLGLTVWLGPIILTTIMGTVLIMSCLLIGRRGSRVMADAPNMFGATDTMIRAAFVDAKLAKEPTDIRLVSPIASTGSGWETRIELPSGSTGAKALAKRPELAGTFGVSTPQVAITPDRKNNRMISLAVFAKDPLERNTGTNPLVSDPRPTSLWEPIPVGVDSTGQILSIKLVYSGLLIGGLPRQGKTVFANNILGSVILDPHAELWLADGKGLDSKPIQPLAREAATRDPKSLLELTAKLITEMEARYERLAELGLDKLSREICEREMPLIVLWIDELRHYTHGNPDASRIVGELMELASVGPAAGIIPVLATQRPATTVVPGDLRDLIPIRIALKCSTNATSDTILGAGNASRGANAAELSPEVKGQAIAVGVGPEPVFFRGYNMEIAALTKLADAARDLSTIPRRRLPAAVQACVEAMGDAVKIKSTDLAECLGVTVEELATMLRPCGVRPVQLGGTGNPRGYRRGDLMAATDPL
jgi:DNA segregation ATPase FtsK/SpoIIIE, S-DNA-T family